jgi:predicted aspartyl protease
MRSILFFIVLFSCNCSLSIAQKITTIPFEELYGGVIKIKATVGDYTDTLSFIFDTGSSHISLDSTTVAEMQIATNQTENFVNGIGGLKKTSKTNPLSLHLPNLTLSNLKFNVNDYTILEESYGERIDGIIGFAFINQYLLNVNFDSAIINVYKRGTNYKKPKRSYLWNFDINYLPTSIINFKDELKQQTPFYIDCGAGLALLVTEKYAKDSMFLKKSKKPIVVQIEGVSGSSVSRLTTVKEVKLGPYKFKNVPTYLFNDQFNLLQYPKSVGLIGNDILRRFNWWLDYSKQQLYLTPNKNFYDSFDYSYTGLSVFLVNGLVTITDIIEGSPGYKAGFMKNDIIISIDNTFITSVKQTKLFFQNPKKVFKIIVMRNKEPIALYIKIQSIL